MILILALILLFFHKIIKLCAYVENMLNIICLGQIRTYLDTREEKRSTLRLSKRYLCEISNSTTVLV